VKTLEYDVYECDGCGKVVTVLKDQPELPYGYHGQVTQVGDFGGFTADWFACRQRCVGKAVIAALGRDD
jgi:hypothetical protein